LFKKLPFIQLQAQTSQAAKMSVAMDRTAMIIVNLLAQLLFDVAGWALARAGFARP
jgi:hypothetical protein